ncbi:DNA-3-methyladenine glycosylase [Homoserinibacter sp. YIM 151385]|uniref:DNA-3-methyladenine glycosylase n=1 Tax=Homoserinibacter sp. YIM 151385 TaxID=2985506 RepID=UPI0022EFDE89|nr:DNA-3-methyladenine glycosylase [Homoserinibacter sp. YIM 151385]WBU38864.1 DNA-3-methyladenine glycosylase [Homoserinibacter sp. YIM 151385]
MTAAELAAFLARPATEVAPRLLGAVLRGRGAAVRLTEVEAYLGVGEDPGSHAHRGRTPRTAPMFGPPGHLYVYLSYGMHACANIVCSPDGAASAVLLRGGEIVEGRDAARARRSTSREDADLARGPARLATALGLTLADSGASALHEPFALELPAVPVPDSRIRSGPRTGVSGDGGLDSYPWRFRIDADPTVSPYRAHSPRRR